MTITYETDFNKLAESIHANNVKAGWWTDIKTGESITPLEIEGVFTHRRNPGELLALVHSEISEAIEAKILNIKDSHLTEQKGVLVEIADAVIRILDIAGAYRFRINIFPEDALKTADEFRIWGSKTDMELNQAHIWVSRALEGFRKNQIGNVERNLNIALLSLQWCYGRLALSSEPDFFNMIHLKREYNLQRADHKIENRLKDNGKKI